MKLTKLIKNIIRGWKWPQRLLLVLCILSAITDGAGDALMDSGSKHWGHFLNAFATASTLFIGVFTSYLIVRFNDTFLILHKKYNSWRYIYKPWLFLIISFVLIRFGFFDITYGIVHPDVDWHYIGSTSWYDNIMNLWGGQALVVARVVFLLAGITILKREV